MPRNRRLLLLALVVAATALSWRWPWRKPPLQRIVLITIDTLRFDAFGTEADQTRMPLTWSAARDCARFDNFYAATSTTLPSHASMFTGLHPWQHGVTSNLKTLGARFETIAESLHEAGYETAAVVASYVLSRPSGCAQGFDRYDERPSFDEVLEEARQSNRPGPTTVYYSLAPTITAEAIAALDRADRAKPQFFWFHYFDPHEPYGDTGSEPALRPVDVKRQIVFGGKDRGEVLARLRRLYDLDVDHLDRSLSRVLARLDEDQNRFKTHVLLVSDHGESLGEDDSVGHGSRLDEAQIHVPFVLCSPQVAPGSRRDVAGSVDVAATIGALAGIDRRVGSGRDLTRRARRGRSGAVGMRRTRRAATSQELRLDGRRYPLSPLLFYFVDDAGTLYRGDGRGASGPPGGEAHL
jgi:arylsulfatase A-like enzyme